MLERAAALGLFKPERSEGLKKPVLWAKPTASPVVVPILPDFGGYTLENFCPES